MYFDVKAAKLLKAGEHLVIEGCPGLRLVVSATRKTWTYRYKAVGDGRMKQVAIGQYPAVSVQAAASQWQALRDQRGDGADPVTQRKAVRQAQQNECLVVEVYTVRNLVDDYVKGHIRLNRKNAGALAAERALGNLLEQLPDFADKPAASIKRADAFDVLDARKATPTAAQKLRSLLGAAWDYGLDSGRLDGDVPNWWRMVMKGRLKSKGKIVGGEHVGQQRRVLQPAEVATLLAWLPNMHTLGRDSVQMYLWTCARGSEILGMQPEHIKKEGDVWWWTVPKNQTKNDRHALAVDLRVPLFGLALEIVQRRIENVGASGLLFEDDRGEQYEQKDFSTYIYQWQPYSIKEKGGLTRIERNLECIPVVNWTPHNLRRTGRTLLAQLGCPNEIGEAIIGHMPENIVGTYNAYTYDAERVHWLGQLSAYLSGLAKPDQTGLPALP